MPTRQEPQYPSEVETLMALNPVQLTQQLITIFQAMLPSPGVVASQLANAYTAYAKGGQFGASTPFILPTNTAALQGPLLAALLVPAAGNPATFAAAWAAGVVAFWAGVPIVGPQVGTVIPPIGAAALSGVLIPVFSNIASTAPLTAALLAGALHTATLTTSSTVAPPPATVLPIL